MSSMAPVNHGPQLLDEENYPSGLTKKVELAEGKNVHKSIYISSYVPGAEVQDNAKGK